MTKSAAGDPIAHILRIDPAFQPIIADSPFCPIGSSETHSAGSHRGSDLDAQFADLVDSVVAQQLSTKAANTICARLKAHLDGQLTPVRILELDDMVLRGVGLSGAKTRTIRGLAEAFHSGALDLQPAIAAGDDTVVRTELMRLWGIGRWTTEMFLIFTLHRMDIWPVGDLAMRRGWQQLHGRPGDIEQSELDKLGERFRPYRSIVAWYCWRQVDGDNPSW
jgi:DNA-3-methyladenine glycosylase II